MPASSRSSYWVYLLASQRNGTLYVGVTNDLRRRIWQHKHGHCEGFTRDDGVNQLVYFEEFADVRNAIAREKQIKGWRRQRKLGLIEATNPHWQDFSAAWFDPQRHR